MCALEAGEQPSVHPDAGHLETYDAVRELHPEINGETVQVPEAMAVEYVNARSMLKTAKDREQTAKTLLAEAMGEAKIASFNGYPIADRRAKGTTGTPYVQAARALPTVEQLAPTHNVTELKKAA